MNVPLHRFTFFQRLASWNWAELICSAHTKPYEAFFACLSTEYNLRGLPDGSLTNSILGMYIDQGCSQSWATMPLRQSGMLRTWSWISSDAVLVTATFHHNGWCYIHVTCVGCSTTELDIAQPNLGWFCTVLLVLYSRHKASPFSVDQLVFKNPWKPWDTVFEDEHYLSTHFPTGTSHCLCSLSFWGS